MKKIVITVLSLALLITLVAGCGQKTTIPDPSESMSEASKSSPTESNVETQPPSKDELSYVGIVFPLMNHEFWVNMANDIKVPLESAGIKVEIASSDDDHAKQLELVENFASKGVDGLVLFPIGASDIGGTLENLQKQGVRVVVMANEVDRGYDAMLLTNYEEVGKSCARMAATWIDETFPDAEPGSIEVGMITITMSPESKSTCDGMAMVTEYTDKASIVATYDQSFTDPPTKAQDNTEMMLGVHPNIKCILVYSSALAPGVEEVVLRTPAVETNTFGIFTNTYSSDIGERISLSKTNESVIRGVNIIGTGEWGYVADAVFGSLALNEDKIYYDVVTDITAENVDPFLN